MQAIKGPGLFLAQFAQDVAPHNSLMGMAERAVGDGCKAVQIPNWDRRLFDLDLAFASETYCNEVRGGLAG